MLTLIRHTESVCPNCMRNRYCRSWKGISQVKISGHASWVAYFANLDLDKLTTVCKVGNPEVSPKPFQIWKHIQVMRYTPMRCIPISHMPMRCTPERVWGKTSVSPTLQIVTNTEPLRLDTCLGGAAFAHRLSLVPSGAVSFFSLH
jgi:hypothetical protein